jgi:predicted RNase H-like HicB family nuclease
MEVQLEGQVKYRTSGTLSYGVLEVIGANRHIGAVTNLQHYQREALKQAKVVRLSAQEGFVAKIPGLKGLLAVGGSRREALLALESALDDWISIKLSRRLSLPKLSAEELHSLIDP